MNYHRGVAVPLALVAAIAAATTVLACGCSAVRSTAEDQIGVTIFPPSARHDSLTLHGKTLAGTTFSMTSVRGHVVVVNVWASWCRPCRAESGVMAAAARRFAAVGVRFVGVDEHDDAAKARSFIAAAGERYPQLYDPDGGLMSRLPLLPLGIPSTLVLDRRGRPAARIIGPASGPLLDKAVSASLRTR